MPVQLQYVKLITDKTNAADLLSEVFAILNGVTLTLKIQKFIHIPQILSKSRKQRCNKGLTFIHITERNSLSQTYLQCDNKSSLLAICAFSFLTQNGILAVQLFYLASKASFCLKFRPLQVVLHGKHSHFADCSSSCIL